VTEEEEDSGAAREAGLAATEAGVVAAVEDQEVGLCAKVLVEQTVANVVKAASAVTGVDEVAHEAVAEHLAVVEAIEVDEEERAAVVEGLAQRVDREL